MREALRYQFPPPEHKHLLGPFTTGQIAITLVTLFVAVFGIARPNPTLPRIVLAAGLVLAVVVPGAVPWRGRIVTEWVPIAARYLRARRAGRTDYRTTAGRQGTSTAGRVLLPAEVGAVEFLAHPHNGGVVGVVVDRRAGLYTAVLEVESPSFLLEETARQEELMARWGVVLARLASSGTSVHRLQWVVRTVPDDGRGDVRDDAHTGRAVGRGERHRQTLGSDQRARPGDRGTTRPGRAQPTRGECREASR